jgi:hypothetical protein
VRARATLSLGNLEQVYSGTPRVATVRTEPAGLSGVTVEYFSGSTPVSAPVAGAYEVRATLTHPVYGAEAVRGTLVVAKASRCCRFNHPSFCTTVGPSQSPASRSVCRVSSSCRLRSPTTGRPALL